MNDDTYWYWLLGGSAVVLLGGLGYASYKAVPGILEREAPELLPEYQGFLDAPDFAARAARARRMLDQLAGNPLTPLPAAAPPIRGTIEYWYDDNGEIRGYARDVQGVLDGDDIAITPLRVVDGVAYTPRSAYRLGIAREPNALERRRASRNLQPHT